MDVEEEHANDAVAGAVKVEEVDDGILSETQISAFRVLISTQVHIPLTQRRNRSANDVVGGQARDLIRRICHRVGGPVSWSQNYVEDDRLKTRT